MDLYFSCNGECVHAVTLMWGMLEIQWTAVCV